MLRFETTTDAEGRYRFGGLPPHTTGEVTLHPDDNDPDTDGITARRFRVDGPAPFTLPSLLVPVPRKPAADAGPTVKLIDMPRPVPVPAGPSRDEVQALIRSIGRDPVTPKLVDRLVARSHPRLAPPPFDQIRQLATDPDFAREMDDLAHDVLHRPLDTIMLLRCALEYWVDRSNADMRISLRTWSERDRGKRLPIRGLVTDAANGRPIVGARVSCDIHDFTDDGFILTDVQGRFTLRIPPEAHRYLGSAELIEPLKEVPLWIEAEGRASGLRFVPLVAGGPDEEQPCQVGPEAPFFGAVVDTSGRPVAGALVLASAPNRASVTGQSTPERIADMSRTFAALTGAGAFRSRRDAAARLQAAGRNRDQASTI